MTATQGPIIFLTGSTGFVGGAVIAHALESGFKCRFVLLVRATDAQEGLRRVLQSVGRFVGQDLLKKLPEMTVVIPGEITSSHWHHDKSLESVTHALHLAADTSFFLELGMPKVNVEGALLVATSMRDRSNLKRYMHVGTAMICGNNPPTLVEEDMYPHEGVVHPVLYPKTKADAEMQLQAFNDLPMVIVRPSIAVGHTRLGTRPSGSIFWTFRAVHALKKITWKMSSAIDVLPVDYVAEALLHLLLKDSLDHTLYHISAGKEGVVRWEDVGQRYSACLDEMYQPYHTDDFSSISEEDVRTKIGKWPASRFLCFLERYYRFGKLNVVFDNTRLLAEGMYQSPRFTDYLERCLDTSAHLSVFEQMRDG